MQCLSTIGNDGLQQAVDLHHLLQLCAWHSITINSEKAQARAGKGKSGALMAAPPHALRL